MNPHSGEVIREYADHTPEEVDDLLRRACAAQQEWQRAGFGRRASCLRDAAGLLIERTEDCARVMAIEMGKPVDQARDEVEKCARVCRYYADRGEQFLADRTVDVEEGDAAIVQRPLGAVLAIMPWNYPFWQVFRFAAPTLMAGNVAILKHAPRVQGCAEAIARIWRDAGAEEGVFANARVGEDRIEELIARPEIAAVTLTGSVQAGRAVGAAAGRALKPSVLELGGSDPYVVLEDADVDAAVEACVQSRLLNSGQSCIAAKRFIAVEAIADEFRDGVVEAMRDKTVGDPLESVDLGPLARLDLRDHLHGQVEESVARGARLLLGGDVPAGPGAHYPPAVLDLVRPGMPAYDQELFGPVASVIVADEEDQAVSIAVDSAYGLGAAVFTGDRVRGERIARDRLRAGCCFVNDFVRSDPRLPFGGIGDSGYGRELGSDGILEFVNTKTVYVANGRTGTEHAPEPAGDSA